MPGGPELLIILAVIAIPVAIVFVAIRSSGGPSSSSTKRISTVRVAGDGRTWLVEVAGDLHRLKAHQIEWLSADVLLVEWRRRSGWTYLIAIVFFPIGLLALLFTMTTYGTIAITETGQISTIRLAGEFSNAGVDAVNNRIAD